MSTMNFRKYRPFPAVDLPDRKWPTRTIDKAPIWCSVDLRDGNQALIEPMGIDRKLRMFELLVSLGFKEIEVGFPSASATEFEFVRTIIEEGRVPDDVTIQVLTQSREELILRTFEALRGAKRVIVHLYNSTSTLQRRVVFGLDRAGIVDIAVRGARLVKELSARFPDMNTTFEYSPESFTGTELDFAKEICDAVTDVWQPSAERRMIVNLPATVEMATPNVYADQIEWFHRNAKNRESFVLSVHPHNDRGTAVAAAELALLAGAERIEGTLFGNGERTGNVDVMTLALNLYTQGIDPKLQIDDINSIADVVTYCNRLPIHPRHPYVGDLVFTAFSGSHQDAIKKGLAALREGKSEVWDVPYLPIDPLDIGRSYEAIIRINSQSGKGGVAYVMEEDYGLRLPRKLQIEFSRVVQKIADDSGLELAPAAVWAAFERQYLSNQGKYALVGYALAESNKEHHIAVQISEGDTVREIRGSGNGPIDAFVAGLKEMTGLAFRVSDYAEHALGEGADARAVAYVEVALPGRAAYGVAMDPSIVNASLGALLGAVNRLIRSTQKSMAAE